jgi:hypothetical protein
LEAEQLAVVKAETVAAEKEGEAKKKLKKLRDLKKKLEKELPLKERKSSSSIK